MEDQHPVHFFESELTVFLNFSLVSFEIIFVLKIIMHKSTGVRKIY